MKNIWNIYKDDLKSIVAKVMTIVVIGGLIFLPSLYAWLNIKASWDPYGKTDQIPIGFVNQDKGATIRDEEVHVGNELAEQLKKDNNFSWYFVDYEEGMEEVEYGTYYATIVVPEDFSETLGSVITDKPEKAEIEYYVNEKINAIAPKITDKGASVIVEEISSQFISTVNGIIFEMFNEVGLELEQSLPDIELFEGYVFTLEEQLPIIHDKLEEMDEELKEANKHVATAEKRIPEVEKLLTSGKNAVNETNDLLNKVEQEIESLSPKIEEEINKADQLLQEFTNQKNTFSERLDTALQDLDVQAIDTEVSSLVSQLETMETELRAIESELEEPNEELVVFIEQIEQMQTELTNVQTHIDDVEHFFTQNEQFYETIETNVNQLEKIDLQKLITVFDESVESKMINEINKAKETVANGEQSLHKVENTLPEIEAMIKKVDRKIEDGHDVIGTLLNKYPAIYGQVEELADKIRLVQSEADLHVIIDLLLNDPEAEKSFFKEPVLLTKNEVFPIENYGTGMTPFYTVLSLWVGGLLLISLLSPNVPGQEQINPRVVYTGRLLTFVTIGIMQTLIVTLGDIFIIGVSISHKFWFVVFGLLISFVFMSIVYTAVAILGDVGKAVAIILLVLQIASSGGTYPVVLLPEFFQMIHPILPFTYGVDLMREAVGGIIWKRALFDVLALIIFAIITLLIGLFLKGPVQKRMSKLANSKGGRLF